MSGGRKESILDLKPLVDKKVHVKLAGGREGVVGWSLVYPCLDVLCLHRVSRAQLFAVEGVLKGYDLLLNLVLDDCIEFLQGVACRPTLTPHLLVLA